MTDVRRIIDAIDEGQRCFTDREAAWLRDVVWAANELVRSADAHRKGFGPGIVNLDRLRAAVGALNADQSGKEA